jgi:hypothetical protein
VSARRNFLAAALVFAAASGAAQVPVRQEQLIYSILAFNGKDYASTFAPADAASLYLLADVENFLTIGNAFVYYWPITQEWKTDTTVLNVPFSGTLELAGGRLGEPRVIKPLRYTYYNTRGEYELNWKVATGIEADQAWQSYQQVMLAYYARMQQFSRVRADYEAKLNELSARIARLREAGQDASKLVAVLQTLPSPKEPEFPNEYIVPPRPVQEAFLLSLPVGEYSIRFFAEDGSVMEGSERKVVSFRKRRAEGVGLEVIPGDKWTRPVESTTPSSILYVNGSADLYLRPFFEQEYNDLYYEKMQRNDARGNPNVMKWVRIQQVPQAAIRLAGSNGEKRIIREEPFFVEQTQGASLGYRIVPYDTQGAHKDQGPSLRAFHIPIIRGRTVMRLATLDKNGTALPGGERQIRVVRPTPMGVVALVLALLPLVVMVVVLIVRMRRVEGASAPATRPRRGE